LTKFVANNIISDNEQNKRSIETERNYADLISGKTWKKIKTNSKVAKFTKKNTLGSLCLCGDKYKLYQILKSKLRN
jgi:hypothetical protein